MSNLLTSAIKDKYQIGLPQEVAKEGEACYFLLHPKEENQ